MTSVGRGVSAAGRAVIPSSSSSAVAAAAAVKQCAGCGMDILDRYLLNAIDAYWHTGCLRCAVCHAALADIGSTCFTRAGLILCKPDYIRSVQHVSLRWLRIFNQQLKWLIVDIVNFSRSAWVECSAPSVCLFVCLSVCPQHNSKTNDP